MVLYQFRLRHTGIGVEPVIRSSGIVAVVFVDLDLCAIDRNLVVVDPEAVALGVAVGEEAALQKAVGRKANSRNHMGGGKGGLLNLGKVVFGVAV